ncbi:hypothetical protein BDZ45DRAFT_298404 [Acephala macrosclerotiorum]|nr:hypothetical protein BDZ45DRAFT_298404 [Acephala macrosclerotiorum]
MGSEFYFTAQPAGYTITCPRYSNTSVQASSSEFVVQFRRKRCPHGGIATCWELLFAFLCSLICSAYTLRYEDRNTVLPDSMPQIQLPSTDNNNFNFILDPPPALMLGACLLLGCSVSSFAYRRQEEDRYQTLIFIISLVAATLFGMALEVSANLVMLGLIPWALCLAMTFSIATHWLIKRCRKQGVYARVRCCETGEKEMAAPL